MAGDLLSLRFRRPGRFRPGSSGRRRLDSGGAAADLCRGVKDTHVAIGTSALAVSVNAFANLMSHARAGTVKWPCASVFALAGIAGAALGAMLGRHVDGQHLLFLFGLVMLAVAAAMFSRRAAGGDPCAYRSRYSPAPGGSGPAGGFLSGFFGIGGGFLIVPAIMLGSGMATINAVGSSLVSVGAFGLTTAATYAIAGLVDWRVAAVFVLGGIVGGLAGVKLSVRLSARRGTAFQKLRHRGCYGLHIRAVEVRGRNSLSIFTDLSLPGTRILETRYIIDDWSGVIGSVAVHRRTHLCIFGSCRLGAISSVLPFGQSVPGLPSIIFSTADINRSCRWPAAGSPE